MSSNSEMDNNDITVYIKMLSGEIFPIVLKSYYGLFLLKRDIRNYLWDYMKIKVTTNEIILFDIDTNTEIIRDHTMISDTTKFKLKKDGMYLLFIRDPIKYEKINFIYTSRGIDLYRFNYVSKDGHVAQHSFSVKDRVESKLEYSLNFHLSFLSDNKCDWYTSFDEMFHHAFSDNITEESIYNLSYIWKYKHLIDKDTSHMDG